MTTTTTGTTGTTTNGQMAEDHANMRQALELIVFALTDDAANNGGKVDLSGILGVCRITLGALHIKGD